LIRSDLIFSLVLFLSSPSSSFLQLHIFIH
jgi:hypothetical protein